MTDTMGMTLRSIHEAYIEKVNIAVSHGDDRLLSELAASYDDEALAILAPGIGGTTRPAPLGLLARLRGSWARPAQARRGAARR